MTARRNPSLRAAGCSGSSADRRKALARLAARKDLDFIFGDWMSEGNMSNRAADLLDGAELAWEPSMMEALLPALPFLSQNKIRFACNAGASDTRRLAEHVHSVIKELGLDLSVAWISGDEVWDTLKFAVEKDPSSFMGITNGISLADWGHEGVYAQAYLGGFGIAGALDKGADIVICGRVADASPLIGACAWWHSWTRGSLDELAGAFVAGHITECSSYATGGNFSGFKELRGKWSNLGYPLIEVAADGSSILRMEEGAQGLVTVASTTAQLLYEIQGPLYYNSDVVADLRSVRFEQIGHNEVRIHKVKGLPPPPTTKVGITARGGYQAEARSFLCGLDIEDKAAMAEAQLREHLPDQDEYSLLKFTVTGTAGTNPSRQDAATVEFRVFAQAKKASTLHPLKFLRTITDQIMQGYPGSTFGMDLRTALPKPYFEYFVTIMPQSDIKHRAHLLSTGEQIDIPPPTRTVPYVLHQESYDSKAPVPLSTYGPTTLAPLGYIVHSRSGDKGSDANVGFFVRHQDEYPWLRDLLSIDKIKELLGEDYNGGLIERFELPYLNAVHFLLKDHLDRGVASSSTYDVLGKNVGEYLRYKHVPLPNKFLARSKI